MRLIDEAELADLLTETGHQHHAAYEASDGIDPEWASWYAPYLQARLATRFGSIPTRSDLVYLLVGAERAFRELHTEARPWPEFYAAFILQDYRGT
jgi:hypothetical protein